MEAKLKKELGTVMLRPTGHSGGGCISEGQSYDTDGGRVFVKINHKGEVWLLLTELCIVNYGSTLMRSSCFRRSLTRCMRCFHM